MFTEMLTRIGIGAATVDTRLQSTTVVPGATLNGEVIVNGGTAAQEITSLNLRIMTRYKTDDKTYNFSLAAYTLADAITIEPNTTWQRSFAVPVPYHTPLTLGRTPVFVVTGLDIPLALDPKDRDMLRVMPHPLQERVLQSLDELGFHLWQAEVERHSIWSHAGQGIMQELEFHPSGQYRSRLRELEVIFHLDGSGLDVLLEVDRRARGLGLLFESLNEHYARLRFTNADLERSHWTAQIRAAIDSRL